MRIPPVLPSGAAPHRLYSHSPLSFTRSPPLLIFFFPPPHFSPSSLPSSPGTPNHRGLVFEQADIYGEGIKKKKNGGGFRSVIWCSRFDLCLKFIIKSVSITARRAAGYQGQPNALLMRHSETHIHTQTHTCCSHYVQIGDLQPPLPCSRLMNASVVFMAVGM